MTCEGCERLQRMVDAMRVDLDNDAADLRVKNRQIAALKREIAQLQKDDPQAELAEAVFDYWNTRLRGGRAKAFAGRRQKNVLDRLKEGYEAWELLQAVDGALVDAYTDARGKTHDDLELICRDATYVDRFRDAAERRAERVQNVVEHLVWGSPAEALAVAA